MFVKNYLTDEDFVVIAVCDVCGLPLDDEETLSYHIHPDCYYSLELHAPDSEETLESLGFKKYDK